MSCFLLFCITGLYLEGGAGYVDPMERTAEQITVRPMQVASSGRYESQVSANPMGRIAFGHEWQPHAKVRLNLELRHESWIGTSRDIGRNSVWVSGRVFPWR